VAGLVLMGSTGAAGGLLWWQAETRAAGSPVIRPAMAAVETKVQLPLECTHFRIPFTGLAPPANCTAGPRNDGPLVLLWGDSHAFHHIPGLTAWAEENGSRLLPRTMGACRPTVTSLPSDLPSGLLAAGRSCVEFNASVMGSLPALKNDGLAAVVIAARWSLETPLVASPDRLLADLERLVTRIRAAGLAVLLVADGPGFTYSVPQCIVRRGDDACALTRTQADQQMAATLGGLRRIAAASPATALFEMTDALCSATTCPVVRDSIVLYSDQSHLSVAASRMMTPALTAALKPLLSPRP
jgi:hypothetical protein